MTLGAQELNVCFTIPTASDKAVNVVKSRMEATADTTSTPITNSAVSLENTELNPWGNWGIVILAYPFWN